MKKEEIETYLKEMNSKNAINDLLVVTQSRYDGLVKELYETKNENLFEEIAFFQSVINYLDIRKKDILNEEEIDIINNYTDCFCDIMIDYYYNSELGNSYNDIENMFNEYIVECKEDYNCLAKVKDNINFQTKYMIEFAYMVGFNAKENEKIKKLNDFIILNGDGISKFADFITCLYVKFKESKYVCYEDFFENEIDCIIEDYIEENKKENK